MEKRVKERPILFSSSMVRALLDGSKTQTRRIISPKPWSEWELKSCGILTCEAHNLHAQQVAVFDSKDGFTRPFKCPYGQLGDRLYVRETWALRGSDAGANWKQYNHPEYVLGNSLAYRADGDGYDDAVQEWKPSIHMPRWASRIQLEITGVCVERLQDISQEDVFREGLSNHYMNTIYGVGLARSCFANLWESINGPGSWDANPWVWVVDFKRVKPSALLLGKDSYGYEE